MTLAHQPVTLERLEQGLAVAAYLVVLHGPVVAPIFERLEREIAAFRADHDTVGRAKRLLAAYRKPGPMVEGRELKAPLELPTHSTGGGLKAIA